MDIIHLGTRGEERACNELRKLGYKIIARNFRSRYGEIDLVASRDSVIAFVEVKLRTSIYFELSSVITTSKQRKILRTAQYFLSRYPDKGNKVYRFDVALIEGDHLRYISNAFPWRDTVV